MTHQSPIRKHTSSRSSPIPDKLYFRIGEVARLCDVPAYVLRFWETEFPQLRPNKGGTGQRLFRRRDVEMALRIKSLLYDEGFTIPGARQFLKAEQKHSEGQLSLVPESVPSVPAKHLEHLRRDLIELLAIVSGPQRVDSSEPLKRQRPPAGGDNRTEKLFDFGLTDEDPRKE